MKGQIKAISTKMKSILIDTEDRGEQWMKVTELALPYAKKGIAEYELNDQSTIIKIKMIKVMEPTPFPTKQWSKPWADKKDDTMLEMNKNNNRTLARTCAINNAVMICTARGETEKEQILEQAQEFLSFIEKTGFEK